MRIQHLLALIGTAALSSSVFAAPPAATEAGSPAIASVDVVGQSSYKLRPVEFEGVQGDYALADGRHLRISSAQRKLYAQLGEGKSELVPVAQNVFVSRADGLRFAFDQLPFATAVTVSAR